MTWWDQIIEFNDEYFLGWRDNRDLIFFSNALAGEVGEICNLVKKAYQGGTNSKKVLLEDLAIEAIDVFIYLVLYCEAIGVNEQAFSLWFEKKMKINAERMESRRSTVKETPE